MTSNELKHEAKKQEWSMSIQECRGSGLSVTVKAEGGWTDMGQ